MSTGIGVGVSSAFGGVKASPSFEYSASAFCGNASDPTPTINGTPGGVFTSAPVSPNTGTLVINSSNGRVDLAASDVGNYLVTYTVGGVSESDPFEVLAVQTTGFSYSSNSFSDSGTASPTITGSSGGVFTATIGLSINSSTGVIDLGASTVGGPYTVTYTNTGACQGTPSTFDITITDTVRIIANNFAMEFDGQSYVSVGNPTQLQITGDITISTWFKTDSSSFQGIIYKGLYVGTTGAGSSYAMYFNTAGKITLQFYLTNTEGSSSGTIFNVTTSNSYNDGNWHNITAVKNLTSVNLYVDNVLDGTATATLNYIVNSTQNVTIGSKSDGSFNFIGDIDEVAIWNKAISANAVQEIYNATINNTGFTADLFKLANESQAPVFWNRMGDD